MVAVWPERIRAPRRDDTPWTFADALPTFADLSGAPQAAVGIGANGASIAGRLNDRPLPMAERTLYWEFAPQIGDPNSSVLGPSVQAARRGWTKAVRQPGQAVEIYDLRADPGERHNLSGEQPKLVADFAAFFDVQTRR